MIQVATAEEFTALNERLTRVETVLGGISKDMMDGYITTVQAARYMGISPATVRNLIKRNEITHKRKEDCVKKYLVKVSDCYRYLLKNGKPHKAEKFKSSLVQLSISFNGAE